jgi:hypothetical protein
VVHRVPYSTEGSQNDVGMEWIGQRDVGGPRIQIYATRTTCSDFRPPPATNTGACATLGIAGSIDGVIVSTLTVTHGRGNPAVLGSPPEFLLWVIGDPTRSVRYMISTTWFFGPDC